MLWFNNVLHAYMLRMPFFFAVYSVTLLLFGETGIFVFILLVLIFTVLCILDMLIRIRNVFVILCFVTGTALILLGQYLFGFFVMSAIYRPARYIVLYNAIFVIIVLITLQVADIMHSNTLMICLLIQVMCIFFAKQMESLKIFLKSHYCRQISKKTAMSVIKRSYKFSALCLAGIFIVGVFLINTFYIERIELPIEISDQLEEILANLEEVQAGGLPEQEEIYFEEYIDEESPSMPLTDSIFGSVAAIIFTALIGTVLIFIMIFSEKKSNPSQFEDYEETEFEDLALQNNQNLKRKIPFLLDPNFTVRRLFKKKVRKYSKLGILPRKFDTPKHLARKIEKHENIDKLLSLYHKARYSGQQVTRSEVNTLK